MMEPLNCVWICARTVAKSGQGAVETVDRAMRRKWRDCPGEGADSTTPAGRGLGGARNPASDFVREAVHVAKVAKAR